MVFGGQPGKLIRVLDATLNPEHDMAKSRTAKRTKRSPPKPSRTKNKADEVVIAPPEPEPEADCPDDQVRCPVCGKEFAEQCEHLMFTRDDTDDAGFWNTSHDPEGLAAVVGRINEWVQVTFTDQQLEFVRALLRLPPGLLVPMVASLGGDFARWEWGDYVIGLLADSPTYAGSTDGEAGGGGSSSSWTCYWDSKPQKVKAWRQMARHRRTLQKLAKLAGRLPLLEQE